MTFIQTILPYVQIILSILLVILVLLQQNDAGLGAAFGGSEGSSLHHTRRGMEKILFNTTIIVAILFVLSTAIVLIL